MNTYSAAKVKYQEIIKLVNIKVLIIRVMMHAVSMGTEFSFIYNKFSSAAILLYVFPAHILKDTM